MVTLAHKFVISNFQEGHYHPADLVNGRFYRVYVNDEQEGIKMFQGKIVDNYKLEAPDPVGIERRNITLSFVMSVDKTKTNNKEMLFYGSPSQEKIEYKKVGYVQRVEL